MDLAGLLGDDRNVLLMSETQNGGLFWHQLEPGVYELHTQFLPEGRGREAWHAARQAVDWMMSHTDALELQTKVAESNRGSAVLLRANGAKVWFTRHRGWTHGDGSTEPLVHWKLCYTDWAQESAACRRAGEWWHQEFEHKRPDLFRAHAEDDCHFRAAGAAVLTAQAGQGPKAVTCYNRWARLAGYPTIAMVSTQPLVIDIGSGVQIMVTAKGFEVL